MSKHLNQQPAHSPQPEHAPLSRRNALRRLAGGGLALGAAVTLARQSAAAQASPTSTATEAAARSAIDAINQALATGDLRLVEAAFAPSYVNHTPPRSLTSGRLLSPDRTGLVASLTELREAAPDAVLIVEAVIAAEETAAVRVRLHGTLAPTTAGGSAAPSLDRGGVVMVRVADGLVVESWSYAEAAELFGVGSLAGTGVSVPTPTVAGAAPEAPVAAAGRGEIRVVQGFNAVSLDGVGTLLLTQGDTEALSIEAEPHVLERIDTVVEAGTLFIRPDGSFETDQPIIYHLSLIQLTRLDVTGSAQVSADALTTDTLNLDLSGSAVVRIGGLAATALELVAGGTAQLELAGRVDTQTAFLRDTAHYAAEYLESRSATITAEGASQATVAVSEQLAANASGVGSIGYLGDPMVSQQVSEAGSLFKVG